MGVYVFHREQKLEGVSLKEAWSFFSDPRNLKRITPSYMGFDIVGGQDASVMYPGQMIQYIVKPLAAIPMSWTTEITHVKKGEFFVDEQRQGPYKIWHHQHFFEEVSDGVLMKDIIHYQPPFGWLGDLMNVIVIRKKLSEIFDFRQQTISEIFGVNR